MTQVVPLRYDTALKKAFSQPEIFCQFAEDVLGIKFHTDEVHRGYKFLEPIGQVDIEYDLFAEDPESRIVVEIQHVKEGHFYDRFLYYHLINLVEQVKNSKAYQFDRTVYTIVVLTSPYSENEIDFSVAITDFNPVNEFSRKVDVYPHQLVFVVPRMVNDKTPSGIKVWLELVLDSLDGEIDESHYNSPIFERVIDAVKLDNISPAERRVLKDEESWEDTLIDVRQKEKEDIARALIREGISTEVITRTTGLTAAEIEKLRQS
ncbi:hypothetical protein C6499_19620 [Candidatus Poribacteria bacterium]|nr:MAG: hypothetical protein C6499_19620 [Candidatus Poribacteria bacterium]